MSAKKAIKYICVFLAAPLIVLSGVFFFGYRRYAFISLALSVVACIAFFVSFEPAPAISTAFPFILFAAWFIKFECSL